MDKDFDKIQRLLEQHRYDEAGALFAKAFAQNELHKEEVLMIYLAVMTAYFDALATERAEYQEALEMGIALLQDATRAEQELRDGIDVARVGHEIAHIQKQIG